MNEAQRITEWVEQKKESAIALARAVWGFAEPNWRETQSAAAISAALEAEGFTRQRTRTGNIINGLRLKTHADPKDEFSDFLS